MTGPLAVAVAVVSFNTRETLRACLRSVASANPAETIVVDNGSTDGSLEMVRSAFPHVTLRANAGNCGYGAAANEAMAASSAPVLLLLNSDTVIGADAVVALGRYLVDHPQAAIAGPRLANADGTLQRSTHPFPSAGDALLAETGLHHVVRRVPVLRERSWRTWSHDRARAVPWVLGAALAIRRSAFEAVGGFDQAFFMYLEEVDLCRRLHCAAFEVHFAPVTTVVHLGGASTAGRGEAMQRELVVSLGRYLRRHAAPTHAGRLLGVLRAVHRARLARDRLRMRLLPAGSARQGLLDAVAAREALLDERGLWQP